MSAPDKIYLQWADEESDEDYNEITWCVDQIEETDVEYSRITLEELEALRKENELLRSGAQLGPIVGMEVIAKQETELVALRRIAEAASGVVDNEDALGYPSRADIKKLEEALSKCRAA